MTDSGNWAGKLRLGILLIVAMLATALAAPQAAMAQAAPVAADSAAADSAAKLPAATPPGTPDHFAVAAGGYTPMAPNPIKGMPVAGAIGFQTQYSPNGEFAMWMHNNFLLPVIIGVCIFVLGLLLFVIVRFNARANPTPSRTTHNSLLEVVWTGIPIVILLVIFIPSMELLAKQYQALPKNALTVKATGNQWYWTYSYPDNGGFSVDSYMLNPKGEVVNPGVREVGSQPYDGPVQLEASNRMVVPAGEPIRLQTFGADVIHSFAVPSLWFKLDAVPGRVNEKMLFIKEPGVYYGQCSELCGARHGYMPIVVEALDRPHFNAWVLTHDSAKIDGAPDAPAPAASPSAAASSAAAPVAGAASAAASAASGN